MTISREEIRRVRATVRHGSHVTMSSRTIEMLCDAAERGAEVTAIREMCESCISVWSNIAKGKGSDFGYFDAHAECANELQHGLAALGIDRPSAEEAGK